jgi:rod shape-determining protein MreC
VLLLLTSVLLLTLDLRGNAIFDGVRHRLHKFMEPLESAADVATRPISNAWHGIMDYQDVKDENERLQDELDAQRGESDRGPGGDPGLPGAAGDERPAGAGRLPDGDGDGGRRQPEQPLTRSSRSTRAARTACMVGMAVTTSAGLVGKITTPLLEDRRGSC